MRQSRVVGDIVQIDLGDKQHAYAQVLSDGAFAFYDYIGPEELSISQIVLRPILFMVAVMDHAVKRGRWIIKGHAPSDSIKVPRPTFVQDDDNPASCFIYENGALRPAERAECIGLERAAAWDPTHVEDRLRDHANGRPNKWVESLKLQ